MNRHGSVAIATTISTVLTEFIKYVYLMHSLPSYSVKENTSLAATSHAHFIKSHFPNHS